MAPPHRRRRGLVITLVVFLLLAGGVAGWLVVRQREKPIVIQTEPATRRNLTELVVTTGRIQPVTKVVINPEVSGEIVELPVREGQAVRKGDVLVRIKADPYVASRNSADASHRSGLASVELARAEWDKAKIEYARFEKLMGEKLVSESEFQAAKTMLEVAHARHEASRHQADQAKAALARAEEDLLKTTILAPIDGTVTSLKSERGERVVGTAMMAGTEIMTIAQLSEMEARVDVGEMDVVLVQIGQRARLEVDSFRDRKFAGIVTEIANAARTQGLNTQQEATKFEVRIRVQDSAAFRPGMSVTAEVETRYRTNVLVVPLQSVTTRLPKEVRERMEREAKKGKGADSKEAQKEREEQELSLAAGRRKAGTAPKPVEVVFALENGLARALPVKRGISDDAYTEIVEGLTEGRIIVSGGYKAINRELEDGKRVTVDNEGKAAPRQEQETRS